MVGGETFLLRNICCFLLLLFYLFFFCFVIFFFVFFFFFVCLCVAIFCGPFLILFWCYLIKKQNKYYKKKTFKEKIPIKAIYLVSCYRKYTKKVLNNFLLFLLLSAFYYDGHFFSILCKTRIPRFHGFIVKMMTSWNLWVCQSDYG